MEFTKRLTPPSTSNNYYYKNNVFYNNGYGMPNCTAYAWGRFYELTNIRPKLSTNNAENWFNYNDGYERGTIPKLGAIICWQKGEIGSRDGAGHVAVVEEVYSDGSILTSNSAYNGTNFYTQKIPNNYELYNYTFQGFIYNPINFSTEEDVVNKTKLLQTELNKYNENLVIDGIIGTKTSQAIIKHYYKYYIVRWVQETLNNMGIDCGAIDGISGPNTKAGIKIFQQTNNLIVDGIAGVDTIKAICSNKLNYKM